MLLLIFLLGMLQLQVEAIDTTIPALIVFGDSIVDPGNNNELVTLAKCNFPPYGKDFKDHKATGRFSNGRVPGDMIASKLGLKPYLPAYLGTHLDPQDFLTGVSFASGGCGFDPLTAELAAAISMDEQLNMFEEYTRKLISIAGKDKAKTIISKSLYLVALGTDDLANTYFSSPFRREYDLPSYIQFLVQSASSSLQVANKLRYIPFVNFCTVSFYKKLYKLGARRFIITDIPPIGCLPSQRTLAGGHERDCNTLYNQAAVVLTTELREELKRLNDTLPESSMVLIDMYTPLMDMIRYPSKFGFEEVTRGCCGTGLFEVTLTCNSITARPCANTSKYLFWDSYHPTERAYDIVMNWVFQKYSASFS